MLTITCSGRSLPSAAKIAEAGGFHYNRGPSGLINWGRATANTELNPDITNGTNKRKMRELFAENDVAMPKLYSSHEVYEHLAPLNEYDHGVRFVGRPDQHSKGRGFWGITTIGDLRRALHGTRRKAAATHFMEYIEAEHEYRVHIFRGKSLRISEKKFDGVDSNNRPVYTTIKPTGNVEYVRRAAKKAVEALGLDFGAVDILASDDERQDDNKLVYVLEVNAAPGLGGSMPRVYAEAFRKWYEGEEE